MKIVATLLQGQEPAEKIQLLLSLTNISSEDHISALHAHFVRGMPRVNCCQVYDISEGNFKRTIDRINNVWSTVVTINHLGKPSDATN